MYLSLLIPNVRNEQARRDIRHSHELHRTLITRAFGSTNTNIPRSNAQKEDVLFRLESGSTPAVIVQSRTKPNWGVLESFKDRYDQPYLRQVAQSREMQVSLAVGQRLQFRLVANPTKRLSAGCPGEKRDGKRIAILGEEEQLKWLERKFSGRATPNGEVELDGGLRLLYATTSREAFNQQLIHKGAHALSFLQVQFDGLLEVTNPEQALKTLHSGIGTSKSDGCGLLTLAPCRL